MGDQQIGHRLGGRVVGGVEALIGEVRVLADQVGRVVLELGDQVQQGGPIEGVIQVADHLGGGSARLQFSQGMAGGGAVRVVEQGDVGHGPDGIGRRDEPVTGRGETRR